MTPFDHIDEIRKKIIRARMALMHCYNVLTVIEEVELPEPKEANTRNLHLLRTKAALARKKLGVRLNQLFSSWELYFLDNCEQKNEEALEAQEALQPKEN